MQTTKDIKNNIEDDGFTVIENIYTDDEVHAIINHISTLDSNKPTFRKTNDLFAIRQFLKEVPNVSALVFNSKLLSISNDVFGEDYFTVKSIYFDKPEQSNWFVAYHQDLTISVDKKTNADGYGPWTIKQNQYAVQPPINILENNFTICIHFDNTDENNGALKVIKASHNKGIYRPETIDWSTEEESICNVHKGGIMIMKPLLLHASNRTTNNNKRRVIHIEFSNSKLVDGLQWSEKKMFDKT